LLALEGIAIKREFHARGIGKAAVHGALRDSDVDAMAAVTRNPAIINTVNSAFHTAMPDLRLADPLEGLRDRTVCHIAKVYGRHIGVGAADVPFARNRYTGGLYGDYDVGRDLTGLPEIAANPEHGIIVVGLGKRSDI